MKTTFISIFLLLLLGMLEATHANTFNYKSVGPAMSGGAHLIVTFTMAVKLADNKAMLPAGL